MPALRLLVSAFVVATLACDSKTAEPSAPDTSLPSELPGAVALTKERREALDVPESLVEVLPFGPKTPVAELQLPSADEAPATRGVQFTVRTEVAALTVHGLRRAIATAEKKPRVYIAGPSPTEGRAIVAVMSVAPSDTDALFAADPPHELLLLDDLADFLERWAPSTGIALLAIAPRSVDLDIDQLPGDPEPFLDDLVALAGHLYEADEEARQAFRDSLEKRRSVHLGD